MYLIIALLALIFFVLAFIGLIKPGLVIRWGEKKTRLRAVITYGLLFILCIVLLYVYNPTATSDSFADIVYAIGNLFL